MIYLYPADLVSNMKGFAKLESEQEVTQRTCEYRNPIENVLSN